MPIPFNVLVDNVTGNVLAAGNVVFSPSGVQTVYQDAPRNVVPLSRKVTQFSRRTGPSTYTLIAQVARPSFEFARMVRVTAAELATIPAGILRTGDVVFETNSNQVRSYNGTTWT